MNKGKKILLMGLTLALFATPALAADTVKLGVAGAHSGDLASYGVPSLNAAKILVEEYNAKGGLLGKKIELVAQDDQCKPEMGTNAATKLISEKVDVVFGHICSGATKAALPIYTGAKIIAMSPSATTPSLTQSGENPYFFRTIANDNDQAILSADFVTNTLKIKKIAILHDNGDYGKGYAETNKKLLEAGGKVKVVLFEAINPDAVDFSAAVRKVKREGAEALLFGGYHPVASKLVQQMHREKIKIPMVGPDGLKDVALIQMAGADAEGIYASSPSDTSQLPISLKAHEQHVKMFGSEPGAFFYNAYSAVLALFNAIEKAGSTDTAKIMDALRNNTIQTPSGNLKFSAKGEAAGIGLSMYVVKDGKFVELDSKITLN